MLHPQHPCILQTCFISPSHAWCGYSGQFRPNCFFSPSLQSTRNTDCVKVRTIWIYTSKWSGCTMNMFVICLPSREKCLNIQRECFKSPVVNPHYLFPFVTLAVGWPFGSPVAAFRIHHFLPLSFLWLCACFSPVVFCATAPHPAQSIIVQYLPAFPKLSNGMDRLKATLCLQCGQFLNRRCVPTDMLYACILYVDVICTHTQQDL